MELINTLISLVYYILTGYIILLIMYNLVKSRQWKEELLYIIILLPFILRLLRLK